MPTETGRSEPLAVATGIVVVILISAAGWYGLAVIGIHAVKLLMVFYPTLFAPKTGMYVLPVLAMVAAIWRSISQQSR